ncbi:DUF4145 domain-containing protein [Haladaptatus sp. DYF46]|uniref:DUF4145 domain-containing protein n=1 Tax=Haladaptatus sp. DYF46 TaxID=2886041 RepID=UPI001E2EA7CC|nr:DUF4145 domain-containing protein [Haladaptatus sp. DYF46]
MALQIDPKKARKRIDEFLEQIDSLLDKRYNEGEDEKRSMSTKIDNFAEVAFSEGKEKKNSLHPSVRVATLGEKSPGRKQEDYEESLKRKRRHLEAWKEQIELEEGMSSIDNERGTRYKDVGKEISGINEELPLYANDLEQSLEELRSDHLLASAMITGRVIDHTLDQIKSSQNLGGPKEVLDHLEEKGIVDSREGQITDAIKSYRNVYTHEIGKNPDISEALIILLGCAKLLHNIQEAGETREYDLA